MQLTLIIESHDSDEDIRRLSESLLTLRALKPAITGDMSIRVARPEKLGETDNDNRFSLPLDTKPKITTIPVSEDTRSAAEIFERDSYTGRYDATDTSVDTSTRAALETPIPPLAPTPPVAPTPAAAPTSTNVPPGAPGTSVELDIAGLPWDERIHSSNHKKNGKGEWWAKRNVSAETLAEVQIELRKLLATSPLIAQQDAAGGLVPATNVIDPATLFTQGEIKSDEYLAGIGVRNAPPIPPVPPVAPTVDVQTRFNALVAGIMANKLDFTQIGAGLTAIGVVPSNLPTLKTAAEKDVSLLARAAAQFEIVLP